MVKAIRSKNLKKPPAVVFWGDFNVGKSALINALVRWPLLEVVRVPSTPGFIFIANNEGNGPVCWYRLDAFTHEASPFKQKEMKNWSLTNPACLMQKNRGTFVCYVPNLFFSQLVLVDSCGYSGMSDSDTHGYLKNAPFEMFSVTIIDCEYFGARLSMQILKEICERHSDRAAVVLNKVDQLEFEEIITLQNLAIKRLSKYGLANVPAVFCLSAALECERYQKGTQRQRKSCKREVVELCDIQFDRFRLMLYDWEARHSITKKQFVVEQVQVFLRKIKPTR